MDLGDRQECQTDIQRIRDLIGSRIFDQPHPLQASAFIDLMICLRDLLYKAEQYASRVAFTDDILINERVKDVTGAVTAVRDACCHIDSVTRVFDTRGNRGSHMVGYGKGTLLKSGDLEMKSDYADEIAIFYGKNRLYLKRHIVRAFEEARAMLEPLIDQR